MDVTHIKHGGGIFCIDNVTQVDTQSEGLDEGILAVMGGGFFLYIPRADVFSFFFPFLVRRFYRGVSGLVQRYGAGNGPGVG